MTSPWKRSAKWRWSAAWEADKDQAMKLEILFHPAEAGGFQAEVLGLPGCISEGSRWPGSSEASPRPEPGSITRLGGIASQ